MKQSIQAKINQRMGIYFEKSNFLENNVREVSASSRRILQSSIYDLQRRFQLLLDKKEAAFLQESESLHSSEQKHQTILKLHSRVLTLQQELDSIQIDSNMPL